jgi:hypothetical protein
VFFTIKKFPPSRLEASDAPTCICRASTNTKKISTLVLEEDAAKFQMMYMAVAKEAMDSLQKPARPERRKGARR